MVQFIFSFFVVCFSSLSRRYKDSNLDRAGRADQKHAHIVPLDIYSRLAEELSLPNFTTYVCGDWNSITQPSAALTICAPAAAEKNFWHLLTHAYDKLQLVPLRRPVSVVKQSYFWGLFDSSNEAILSIFSKE